MKLCFLLPLFVCAAAVCGQDSSPLLMGTLVRQGPDMVNVLGNMRDEDVEKVKGKEVGEGHKESVNPEEELLMGESLGDFKAKPSADQVKAAIVAEGGSPNAGYENKKGSLLDKDVESGKYVANPLKVLGEMMASGGELPDEVEGEILAGDAAKINVLTLNE